MKISRAYKVELDPNNEQRTAMLRHCGAARFVYNWGLNRKIEAFKAKEKLPSAMTLAKEIRAVRAEIAPWLTEHSSYTIDSTLPHCDTAFENFFRRCTQGKKGKKGFPKFKSRKRGIGSCRFHKAYTVENKRIRFPVIGWVRLKEAGYIPTNKTEGIKFYSATISEKAGRWYVSVQVEFEVADKEVPIDAACTGVDFGIKALATCSNGREVLSPKPLTKSLRKLRRTNRAMSRKIEAAKRESRPLRDSKNFQKNKHQLAKLHARVANIRANTLHNLSHSLTKNKSGVCIEDLNVAGMMKNGKLARQIADVGFGELRRQIEYKSGWYGTRLVVAARWYPSSKTCGACGAINADLKLQHRHWTCVCGIRHDRDLNAARNLAAYAMRTCQSSSDDGEKTTVTRRQKPNKKKVAATAAETLNACGEGSSGIEASDSLPVPLCETGTEQLLLFEVVSVSEPPPKGRKFTSKV
jgi:putative transposase